MNPYSFNSYKDFLRAFIDSRKARGTITRIAQVCGCDRTYISQVLNGKSDMTPDHILQFCEEFGFDESESEYILALLLRDRSSSHRARLLLDRKIKSLKINGLALSAKVQKKEKPKFIREDLRGLYFSNWYYGAVHILTSIPEFQTDISISKKLCLPVSLVSQVLKNLIEMKLVEVKDNRFVHSGGDIYLSRESSQSAALHLSWRMKAVERCQEKLDIHYTQSFSVSETDLEVLRLEILDLIEQQRKRVASSGAEVACAFCLDFFTL